MGWNRSLQEYNWPSREGEERASKYDPRVDGARCDICPLAGNPVVPSSPAKSGRVRLIVVGEGPGRVEERWRLPFIGPTGAYLNTLIAENAEAGGEQASGPPVSRDDMFVTNTMCCRGESDRDNVIAAACCAPRLLKELSALDSNIPVLALGRAAAQATLGVRSILLSRGFVWHTKPIEGANLRAAARLAEKGADGEDVKSGITKAELLRLKSSILAGRASIAGRTVFPALHPAFVLRLETWAPILEIDIDRAFRAVRGQSLVLRDRGQYRVVSKRGAIHRELGKLGGVVAVDIETTGIDPLTTDLLCVGVSDGVRTVIIHPGAGKVRGKRWKSFQSDALTQLFRNCRAVVMHNGYNFDQVVLKQHGVDFTGVNLEDTLLAHHAFASHLPKKLDQVVSEYVDASPWKVKHGRRGAEEKGLLPHKMPAKEVCLYNAGDVRLTAIAWEGMQGDLEEEREVYEHDKKISEICQQMLIDGIYMDKDRRSEIRRAMRRRGIGLKQQMRDLLHAESFAPMKTADVRWALYHRLKAPVLDFTPTGLPATNAAQLEEFRKLPGKIGKFCELLLQWRVVEKVRGTYLEAIPIHADGRVHYTWRPYGTVSGRWACRFQSLPRKTKEMLPEDRMGECYAAPPGWDLWYFDLSQSEMRAASYLSADPEFMRVCEGGDVHAGNASVLFPTQAELGYFRKGPPCERCLEKKPHEVEECSNPVGSFGKGFRDIAKNAGFGILYSAEIDTIFGFLRGKGFDVQREDVVAMFDEIHKKYAVYYDYCNENIGRCRMGGHLRTALMGRIRWLGWYPKPGDVYNFPIQSFIADLMNLRLIELRRRLPKRVKVVAQIHDALVLEARQGRDSRITGELIKELWAEPVRIPTNGLEFVMPIDQKIGERLIEFR